MSTLLIRIWLKSLLMLLCVFLSTGQAQDFVPVPELKAHVTDKANMLTKEQLLSLGNYLKDYESHTGSQIAVLLIDNTAPETIEQYSIRVADTWKLGRKGIDDGVILLVAKNNPAGLKRLRLETGRGVQGVLTDMRSKQILQDVIAPYFQKNNFYNGLLAGVSAITSTLEQETFPSKEQTTNKENGNGIKSWLPFLILIFFFIIVIYSRSRRNFGKNGEWGATGIILGGSLYDHFNDHDDFGGGFSGDGGGFDGGGASGDW